MFDEQISKKICRRLFAFYLKKSDRFEIIIGYTVLKGIRFTSVFVAYYINRVYQKLVLFSYQRKNQTGFSNNLHYRTLSTILAMICLYFMILNIICYSCFATDRNHITFRFFHFPKLNWHNLTLNHKFL